MRKLNIQGKIDLQNFTILNEIIGEGGYGKVHKVQDKNTKKIYAAKFISLNGDNDLTESVYREIEIMMSCIHPTIVKFVGYTYQSINDTSNIENHNEEEDSKHNHITILMEYMTKGSLSSNINKSRSKINNTNRQIILVGIAYGMKYLHDRNIIHRDLKPLNVLLDENFFPHICDFGLSKMFKVDHTKEQSKWNGTIVYMAPEMFNGEEYDQKIDVYSFGILMYEVLTGLTPFPDFINGDVNFYKFGILICNKTKLYRPKFEGDSLLIKKAIRDLTEKCWHPDPEFRPTFEEIFNLLSVFYNEDKKNANDYCLDDVDMNKLKDYLDKVTTIVNPVEEHMIKDFNLLKQKYFELKIKEQSINKNKIKDDSKISGLFKIPIENEKMTMNLFNCLPISVQQSVISGLIEKYKENQFYSNLNNLLIFLNEIDQLKDSLCLEIIANSEEEKKFHFNLDKDCFVKILPSASEILFCGEKIQANITELKKFNDLLIEIKYPSDKFKDIYNIISTNGFKIGILISELNEMDPIFQEDKSINLIRFESSINEIKSNDKSGFFHDCSLLEEIIFPPTIVHIGSNSFNGCTSLTRIFIPSSITKIGKFAFKDCSLLEKVSIPPNVTKIGCGVFCGCSSLKEVFIPSSVTEITPNLFSGCKSLTQIQLPSSITEIQSNAFEGCSSLELISIPSKVKVIGDYAFNECSSLTQIIIPPKLTKIGIYAFRKCSSLLFILIPPSVCSIGKHSFDGCKKLMKIVIPDSVSYIGKYAFNSCSSLTKVTIPSSTNVINPKVFNQCTNLKKVTFHPSITLIGDNAFNGCQLTQLDIPSSVKTIGSKAFYNCKLTELLIPSSDIAIEQDCFEGCVNVVLSNEMEAVPRSIFNGNSTLTKITIPLSIKKISSYAFSNCPLLECVTIPSSVTRIGKYSFFNCCLITSMKIPSSVTEIGQFAFASCTLLENVEFEGIPHITTLKEFTFSRCSSLKSFVIPDFVDVIETGCFQECDKLTEITIPSKIKVINDYTFSECGSLIRMNIPSSINKIGQYSFNKCLSLNEIKFENSSELTLIGSYCFNECVSLVNISIPSSVQNIGEYAFNECKSLVSITIPQGVKEIKNNTFYNCENLSLIKIPNSVLSIGEKCFVKCSKLAHISLPPNLTEIRDYTFTGCSMLTKIVIPPSVNSIGIHAFAGCLALKKVKIPPSLVYIGPHAFSGCLEMQKISIPSSVEVIGQDIFDGCQSLKSIAIPRSLSLENNIFPDSCKIVKK